MRKNLEVIFLLDNFGDIELDSLEAKLNVLLLNYTPEPERTVAMAAKLCYNSSTIPELLEEISKKEQAKFIQMLVASGHMSPIEHAVYTFGVEGISRACSHQLVRHRIASYSQQSQRYVNYKNLKFIVPPEIAKDEQRKKEFLTECLEDFRKYLKLVEEGYSEEDSRFVLPNATETKMIITMNARELLHFYELRTCERAQWEIRNMAKEMLKLAYATAPNLFKDAGPNCLRGPCTEGKYKCKREIPEIKEEFEELKKQKD